MNKIIKVMGIVIAENPVSDSDKMLTILTSEYGKINAIAKNSRSMKSSLLSGTQFLCFSDFTLYKASKTFRVNEAVPIEMFYNIYEDYNKLVLATNITKAINCVALENYFEHNLLKLFLNTLKLISNNIQEEDNNDKTNEKIKTNNKNIKDKKNNKKIENKTSETKEIKPDIFIESVFKLKLLSQLGYTPELVSLPEDDKNKYELIFDIDDNRVIMVDEHIKIRNSVRIQKETLYSLKYIFTSDIDQIFNFSISDRILVELSRIAEKYFDKCIY